MTCSMYPRSSVWGDAAEQDQLTIFCSVICSISGIILNITMPILVPRYSM